MIKVLPFILAVLLLIPGPGMADNSIRVVSLNAPPMIMVKNDKITGLAADLAKEAFHRAGYSPQLQLVPWKRALYMVTNGQADALFYAIYTEERAKVLRYPSIPLFTIDLVALKRAKSAIVIKPNFRGLQQWVLGVGRGFTYGPKAQRFIDGAAFNRIETTNNNELGFRKLLGNRIDLHIMDKALAHHFLADPKDGHKADYVRDEQGEIYIIDSLKGYMVFSRQTTSKTDVALFTKALESMHEDGTYQKILDTYQ
ncbi:transporter substrate-binding domain-containing protein [Pseudodesulfovibrio sp. zrk46]|uniref:substrate-binding periplasmic protein n=1 Tax=Pseudodesulfovibrio sp. zrk46 TaxID=2725288 RepID=UPI001449F395|nr:transporter substrate-binding domain-containing protein [Pseudodesulfovibrio sp. zrk46]QJB55634.1 amino acid ABC transporter substrate-binding protein [Pseudodesulfovibrio sp. zrk46]